MYDPQSVAFDLHYPWPFRGKKDGFWPNGRPIHFITIWHVDPEKPGCGGRADDSCGWFTPPSTKEERDHWEKIASGCLRDIFPRRAEMAKGDPNNYAYVCFEPTYREAVYWTWRRIKQESEKKHIWKFGGKRGAYLSTSELEYIECLASSPVDNLRVTIDGVKDENSAADFFMLVWNAYRRFNRSWWKHPRWHFWHWKLQIHPWQQLRRRLFDRCAHCGKPFIKECPVSHSWHSKPTRWFRSAEGLYHGECSSHVMAINRAQHEKNQQALPVH